MGTPEQKRGLRSMPRRKNRKPEKLDIVWNVIYENINSRSIETFNVFDHGRFVEDIKKHFKTCETKELFADHLRRSVMYYFWSKCEWEVLVTPLCEGRSPVEKKIDVAWQLINNWEVFVDYVWSARPQKRENAARKNSGDGNERHREDLQDWRICETGKTESPQQ